MKTITEQFLACKRNNNKTSFTKNFLFELFIILQGKACFVIQSNLVVESAITKRLFNKPVQLLFSLSL